MSAQGPPPTPHGGEGEGRECRLTEAAREVAVDPLGQGKGPKQEKEEEEATRLGLVEKPTPGTPSAPPQQPTPWCQRGKGRGPAPQEVLLHLSLSLQKFSLFFSFLFSAILVWAILFGDSGLESGPFGFQEE